jgi:hypothetical protein
MGLLIGFKVVSIKVTLTGVDLEPHSLHLVDRQVSCVVPFSDHDDIYLLSLFHEKTFLVVIVSPTSCSILSTVRYVSMDYLWNLVPIYDSDSTLRYVLLRFKSQL